MVQDNELVLRCFARVVYCLPMCHSEHMSVSGCDTKVRLEWESTDMWLSRLFVHYNHYFRTTQSPGMSRLPRHAADQGSAPFQYSLRNDFCSNRASCGPC